MRPNDFMAPAARRMDDGLDAGQAVPHGAAAEGAQTQGNRDDAPFGDLPPADETVGRRRIGRLGATLMRAEHGAGLRTAPPAADLVLTIFQGGPPVTATVDLGAGRFTRSFRHGDIVLSPPHLRSSVEAFGAHKVLSLAVPYRALLALAGPGTGLPEDGDFGHLHADRLRSADIAILATRLWDESTAPGGGPAVRADGAVLMIAGLLLAMRDRTVTQPQGGLSPWVERRIRDYLEEALDRDTPIVELAAMAGLSPFHFARAFKQSTGMPPHAYLRHLRTARAKALLSSTRLRVSEIALQVGYETPQAFARMFRTETGMRPTMWRRERREQR
jgi:AraC family transcriptional regulator